MVPKVQAESYSAKRICEYISVNDKTRFRVFLKKSKVSVRDVFSNIRCGKNKDNLLVFAAKSQALDTGEFIIGKLSKEVVSENLLEIEKYSAHLAEDANDRIE